MNRGICAVCGEDQPLKKDGTVYKHDGCEGSGQLPAAADPAEPADNGDDWLDDEDTAEPEPDESSVPPLPAVVQDGPIRDVDGVRAYCWEMHVKHPAIYLADVPWHQENGKLAVKRVAEAGYKVTGEAQWDGVVAGGHEPGTVLLTYLVPVAV